MTRTFVKIGTSQRHTSILQRFYQEIYVDSFPDPNERESFENMQEYLFRREARWYGSNNYHIHIAVQHRVPVGGIIADYFRLPNAGAIEFLAVSEEHRGTGLGRKLLDSILKVLRRNAITALARPLDYAFAEMNDPRLTDRDSDNMDPESRALIWERWGFFRLNFPYVQPPLSDGQAEVRNLCLIVRPDQDASKGTVPSEIVRLMVHQYMVWAMRIDSPETNTQYRTMNGFLESNSRVSLGRL